MTACRTVGEGESVAERDGFRGVEGHQAVKSGELDTEDYGGGHGRRGGNRGHTPTNEQFSQQA